MFRLYSNENFPLPVVEELRRLGCDVTTVLETGRAGQAWPDEDVLRYATDEDRVLLTLNRKHFIRLHHAQIPHTGIVACTVMARPAASTPPLLRRVNSAVNCSA